MGSMYDRIKSINNDISPPVELDGFLLEIPFGCLCNSPYFWLWVRLLKWDSTPCYVW